MKQERDILRSIPLLAGIGDGELDALLSCLGGRTIAAARGEYLLHAGERVEHIGVVLAGRVQISRADTDGRRTLLAAIPAGGMFGETLCCAEVEESPVSVQADADSRILLLPFSRLLGRCPNSCAHHTRLVANMLRVVAEKNLYLQMRLELLEKRSLRERVLAYLTLQAPSGGRAFSIPFSREELADFLRADRSALSRVLGQLRDEGLVEFRRNRFRLL